MNRATTPAFKVMLENGTLRPGPPGWDVPYLHNAIYRAAPVVAKPTPEAADTTSTGSRPRGRAASSRQLFRGFCLA